MGYGKLNVWVRTLDCALVTKAAVTVVDCHGRLIASAPWAELPRELKVPPGCYIVRAHGCIVGQGNYESDRCMVIVRCGEEMCVNLLVPTFAHCVKSIIQPLVDNARRLKIPDDKIGGAIGVLAKAAELPPAEILKKVDLRINDFKDAEEVEEKEHLKIVKGIKEFCKKIKF
ncbi:MAG: hypothetical protein PHD13_01765 [Methanocellales archaeon]|nr:hypothetical protein [Methanocellales archaeon]MDD3291006.1 hypothetical protein [Methanocellales archaeon]MDD5234891.1 hypothetical protein [Methanocellales archaeon]MDD5484739.1 hypothetical protein [Methanocellales archaeon]